MINLPHWPTFGAELTPTLRLDRVLALLKEIGSPHQKLPPVFHVAGTNGKGSVIAFARAILEAAGLTVHRYTSPHLIRFNERILLSGNEISDQDLFLLLEECRLAALRAGITVSFFEGTTAAAFLAFSRVKADALLVEVGIGGRLDATNVIEKPAVSVITPISLDHESILGNSIQKIAYEKACIIKKECPCVVSLQTADAYEVIEKYAAQMNAPITIFGQHYGPDIGPSGELIYKDASGDMTLPAPSLPGLHQYVNAATAIAAIKTCYKFDEGIFKKGIANAKWEGRLSKITRGKLFKLLKAGTELWVDSAHNEGGAQALATWLKDQPKKRTCLVFNMTKNRDINRFLPKFHGLLDKIIFVNIYSEPMSYSSDVAQSLVQADEFKAIASHTTNLEDAFQEIVTANQFGRVLIAGSMFLAADFFLANK